MEQTNILGQLNSLAELQALDGQIYQLKKEKGRLPLEIIGLQNNFNDKQKSLGQYEDKLKVLQLKRKEKEVELETKEGSIKKYQAQLYQIKTNKEYSALLQEIENLKADNSVLEEEILKVLDDIDAIRIDVARKKEALAQEEKMVLQEKEKIEGQAKVIAQKLEELNNQRAKVTPKLEGKILAHYERVLKNKDGLALVSVESDSCQGCHINLPPQVINEVKMHERIVSCESCARILYSKD
jgi:predicted  nucleic acid-binding Zn-ribbon protein